MKTIKELLILLREKLPEYIPSNCKGLCSVTRLLRGMGIINYEEKELIDDYLYNKRPAGTSPCGFWWPYGELAPRLEFIDKLIAELE